MLLEDKFKLEIRLSELREKIPTLSLLERLDVEDEILEIKEQLGEFKRQTENGGDECINCSG